MSEPARGAAPRLNAGEAVAPALERLLRVLVVMILAGVVIAGALLAGNGYAAETRLSSARVWPAPEYTRITLESPRAISYKMLLVADPHRLVLDLEQADHDSVVAALTGKVTDDNPHIVKARVARYKPGVVRVVFDLRVEAKPQIFALQPVGEYGHRLVVDVYPAQPADPLLALLVKPDGSLEELPPARPDPAPVAEPREAPADTAAAAPDAQPPAERPAEPAVAKPAEKGSEAAPEKSPRARPAKAAKGRKPTVERLVTVAIDAGHGGEDPGAKGRHGTLEKDVTLAIARRLKDLMDEEPGMRGFLVRDADYFVPLAQRVSRARRVQADLFVSIHADAFVRPDAHGSSVYALSERGATSAAARWLAKTENEADLIGGVNLDVKDPYLAQTLLDLSQTATINDSIKLAKAVLDEIGGINRLHKPEVEQAGFAVLKAPDIPSILVETAFISNPKEEKRLGDTAYQDKMARAILAGIKRYFAANPPLARSKVAQLEF